ncbi:hypothetical protein [Hymenobacter metallicola]|uniref:Uncharacterized protein n=1 Tax=Hymenobacter metallicola TaxID=2563114 RepID=A0A4Z0Q330_9BACT|nr:hypothetical protein [Hymenobacter metallicola]TGE23501.1 hypothetical protein E5K02_20145 [Hymenobacter metallicola]
MLSITSKKYADGWSATATYNGHYLCGVDGVKTQNIAETMARQAAQKELNRQRQPMLTQVHSITAPAHA